MATMTNDELDALVQLLREKRDWWHDEAWHATDNREYKARAQAKYEAYVDAVAVITRVRCGMPAHVLATLADSV